MERRTGVTKKIKKEKEKLLKMMEKERGYMFPTWVFLADKDVEFLKAYNTVYQRGFYKGKALEAKINPHFL